MDAKIKVHGKAQSRTVLGIVNAYLKLHPETTKEELDKAFPATLHSVRKDSLFADPNRADEYVREGTGENYFKKEFFEHEDEQIILSDGARLAMTEIWAKADYEKVVELSKTYGILAETEMTGSFQRGGFTLEYLGGYNPGATPPASIADVPADADSDEDADAYPEDGEPCPTCAWLKALLWLLGLIVLAALLLKFCGDCPRCDAEDAAAKAAAAQAAQVTAADKAKANAEADAREAADKARQDSIAAAKAAAEAAAKAEQDMRNLLNSKHAGFQKASAQLNGDAKKSLDEIAKYLNENQNLKIEVIGHASPEGGAEYNQKLSEERANEARAYLISKGVAADRVTAKGVGAGQQIDGTAEQNRFVEFKVK